MQLNESEVILATWLNAVNFWSNKFLLEETWRFSNLIWNEIVRMVLAFLFLAVHVYPIFINNFAPDYYFFNF